MDELANSLHIIGFDVPPISSWPTGASQHVFALLSRKASKEWADAFIVELESANDLVKAALPILNSDKIAFLALPSNIGSLRVELTDLIRRVNGSVRRRTKN